jgi:hypothetical protein
MLFNGVAVRADRDQGSETIVITHSGLIVIS